MLSLFRLRSSRRAAHNRMRAQLAVIAIYFPKKKKKSVLILKIIKVLFMHIKLFKLFYKKNFGHCFIIITNFSCFLIC